MSLLEHPDLNSKGSLDFTAVFIRTLAGTPVEFGPRVKAHVTAFSDEGAESKVRRFVRTETLRSAQQDGDRQVVWRVLSLEPTRPPK